MFNQPLSSSMSIAELAPKATMRAPEPRRGDGAFGEALKGARSVHERGESQVDRTRGDAARADRANDRSRTPERPDAPRAPKVERERAEQSRGSDASDASTEARASSQTDDAAPADGSEPQATDAVQPDAPAQPVADADTVAAEAGTGEQPAATTATAAPAIAVAAAPVADLDAIIVPTTGTVTHAGSEAVDAAMRLAISPTGATATKGTGAAPLTPQTAATAVLVDAEAAPATDAAVLTTAARATQGAEAVETGDVQGPTRPLTSTPITTTGPTPATNATTTASTAQSIAATPAAATAEAAAATVTALATGAAGSAAAPAAVVAQAAAEATAPSPGADPATDAIVTTAPTDADADAEPATQQRTPALPNAAVQNASPQAALQAQVHAQAQAKAAEQAAEEGGEQTSSKLDPASSQAQNLNVGRGEQVAAGARVREAMQLGGSVQDRIDHIAEQLSTRLRLSQAAGGSQVQLSLKPRELGDVHVQMKVRDGQVAAIILVDKPETARTMQTQIEDLKRSLENQGLQIQEFSVDVRGEAGAGGANARAAAELNAGIHARPTADAINELAGAAAANPGLDGDLMVDVDSVHEGDVSVLA